MNRLREKLKNEKVIIGMVHLLPLPGSPKYEGDMDKIYEAGLKDLRALEKAVPELSSLKTSVMCHMQQKTNSSTRSLLPRWSLY